MTKAITRSELKDALEAGAVTVVDALPESYFAARHLPGALNLVEADVRAHAAQVLPDKSAHIVTYCSDTTCANSEAVADALESFGYTNVSRYAEGINDWVAAELPVQAGVRILGS